MLGRDHDIASVDEYFAAASEVYDKRKLDIISRGLRYAIESCLKPDFDMDLGIGDPDDDELRSKIFQSVVQPLEEELERAFQEFISINSIPWTMKHQPKFDCHCSRRIWSNCQEE